MQDEKPPMKKLPTSMLPEETAPRPEFPEQEQNPAGSGCGDGAVTGPRRNQLHRHRAAGG